MTIFIIQILMFTIGVILVLIDGSAGYFSEMGFFGWAGMIITAVSIPFYHIVSFIKHLKK